MTTPQLKPFGTWPSAFGTSLFTADYRLADCAWDTLSPTLVWLERRPDGHALVAQAEGENPRDLLRGISISGGNLYGGGSLTVGAGMAYYVSGGRIFRIPLMGGRAVAITPEFGSAAAPTLSPDGRWLLYVHSIGEQDNLALIPSDGSDYPRRLFSGSDFIMQPAWHPAGDRIACVTWDHPHMPWESTQLHLFHLTAEPTPTVVGRQIIAGVGTPQAIFGAVFSPDGGYLAYASDRNGWWEVYRYDLDLGTHQSLTQHDEAEYAVPAWLQGMRTFAWSPDSSALWALRNEDNRWQLRQIDVHSGEGAHFGDLDGYTYLEQIAVSPISGEVALIAAHPQIPDRVLTVNPYNGAVRVRANSSTEPFAVGELAASQTITWASAQGERLSGLYYPPTHPHYSHSDAPPLIVYIHSGPTRQRFQRFFPEVQYFTSRGFAVFEPNYRGSSGYGRAFQLALNGLWGVAEVEDTASGVQFLIANGKANPAQIVVMGSSSGGYSVLQSLIQHPALYALGVAQAPVTDLFALVQDTHKFERYYTDRLVGALPAAAKIYRERSPLFNADKIRVPVALFHGARDRVVPAAQSEAIAAVLRRRRGVPHHLKVYDDEGHSFRKAETLHDYYETALNFIVQHVIYA